MHYSIDLETLSTAPSGIILSGAIVAFDATGTMNRARLAFYPDIDEQVRAGRKLDADTFSWWMRQEDEARAASSDKDIVRYKAADILEMLAAFVERTGEPEGVWGNGSDFDNGIMASYADTFGLKLPWPWWKHRCIRTVTAQLDPEKRLRPPFEGTPHDPMDDAAAQARWLVAIAGMVPQLLEGGV